MPQLNIGDITLTSSGAIQNRPAFHAHAGATQSNTGSAFKVQFTTALTNVGGHYSTSNHRFTAPVTGLYFFYYQYMQAAGTTYDRSQFKLSGSYVGDLAFDDGGQYGQTNNQIIISMNAGQYMEVWTDVTNNGQGSVHDNFRIYQGFLIG